MTPNTLRDMLDTIRETFDEAKRLREENEKLRKQIMDLIEARGTVEAWANFQEEK